MSNPNRKIHPKILVTLKTGLGYLYLQDVLARKSMIASTSMSFAGEGAPQPLEGWVGVATKAR